MHCEKQLSSDAYMHHKSLYKSYSPGARPTKDILIEFEIRPIFAVLWFKMNSTNHGENLHTSRQLLSLWSVAHILN